MKQIIFSVLFFTVTLLFPQTVLGAEPDFSKRYQEVFHGETYSYRMKNADGFLVTYTVTGRAKKCIVLNKKSGKNITFYVDTLKGKAIGKATIHAHFYKKTESGKKLYTTKHDTVIVYNDPDEYLAEALEKLNDYMMKMDTNDDDNDGLINEFEKELGTDKNNPDTDGDGLNDYFEFAHTNTDPTKVDTDNNGIPDGDEDPDQDGLTNKEEQKYKTNPHEKDSDYDKLTDGDEVKKYKTSPTKDDTDKDGIEDGREIELGLDPTKKDSNHNGILDGDEWFTLSVPILPDELDKRLIPTLHITTLGKHIEEIGYRQIDSEYDFYLPKTMPGFIGSGYEVFFEKPIKKATLSFKFQKKLLKNPKFEPAIYRLDEKNEELILLPNQKLNKDTCEISARIVKPATYIVLDKTKFDAVWQQDIRYPNEKIHTLNRPLSIVFAIDTSNKMTKLTPNNIGIQSIEKYIKKLQKEDQIAITRLTKKSSIICDFTSDKQKLYSKLHSLPIKKGNDLNTTLSYSLNAMKNQKDYAKYIIVFTANNPSFSKTLLKQASKMGITVYTISLGEQKHLKNLETISEEIYGNHFHCNSEQELPRIFKRLVSESIDFERDTDRDGLSDYYEKLIAKGKIVNFNGTRTYVDYKKADTDGDGLLDGEEISFVPTRQYQPKKSHKHK